MAPTRMQFELGFGTAGRPARRRDDDAPFRILVLADLGGRRAQPLRERKPLAIDVDNFEARFAAIAPRLELRVGELPLSLEFGALEHFHPDALYTRLPAFAAMRELRRELQDPKQFRRAAAALGLAAAAPQPAAAAPAEAAEAASDIEHLLGRKPATAAAPPASEPLGRLLREIVAPHVVPDVAGEQRELLRAADQGLADLMRGVLHAPAFQALEASWRAVDRLVRGLELGGTLQLCVLDATRDELRADLSGHAGDLSASALHHHLCSAAAQSPDTPRWALWVVDQAFGPGADDVQALAALGAIAARAGAPVLVAATPQAAGCPTLAALAEPRAWLPPDADALAAWNALRASPMAPWIGAVLPRVLTRLPYGAGGDPIDSFDFDEMDLPRRHESYLWSSGAFALAQLAAQAFQQDGWGFSLEAGADLEDLPSHIVSEGGEKIQQPCAELLLGEAAGQALLERGLMPLLSWRGRNAARLMRWQSLAHPAQPLQGLPA